MALGLGDTTTVTISITGIEIIALRKLSIVSHALSEKIGGTAGLEQKTLARTLDDVLGRITLKAGI